MQRGTLIDKRREFKLFESGGGRFGVEGRRSVFEGKTTLRDLGKRVLGSQFVSTRKTTRNHFQLCCLDPWGNRFCWITRYCVVDANCRSLFGSSHLGRSLPLVIGLDVLNFLPGSRQGFPTSRGKMEGVLGRCFQPVENNIQLPCIRVLQMKCMDSKCFLR